MISLSFAHYIVYAGGIEKVKGLNQSGFQEQQGKKPTNDFNVDIVGGFGLPDLLHGGLRMHFGNSYRLGFTIGSLPVMGNLKEEGEKLIDEWKEKGSDYVDASKQKLEDLYEEKKSDIEGLKSEAPEKRVFESSLRYMFFKSFDVFIGTQSVEFPERLM